MSTFRILMRHNSYRYLLQATSQQPNTCLFKNITVQARHPVLLFTGHSHYQKKIPSVNKSLKELEKVPQWHWGKLPSCYEKRAYWSMSSLHRHSLCCLHVHMISFSLERQLQRLLASKLLPAHSTAMSHKSARTPPISELRARQKVAPCVVTWIYLMIFCF